MRRPKDERGQSWPAALCHTVRHVAKKIRIVAHGNTPTSARGGGKKDFCDMDKLNVDLTSISVFFQRYIIHGRGDTPHNENSSTTTNPSNGLPDLAA